MYSRKGDICSLISNFTVISSCYNFSLEPSSYLQLIFASYHREKHLTELSIPFLKGSSDDLKCDTVLESRHTPQSRTQTDLPAVLQKILRSNVCQILPQGAAQHMERKGVFFEIRQIWIKISGHLQCDFGVNYLASL